MLILHNIEYTSIPKHLTVYNSQLYILKPTQNIIQQYTTPY